MSKNKFIIKPFNLLYILLLIINSLICLTLILISKNSNYSNIKDILMGLSIFDIVFFIIYRFLFKFDKEYIDLLYKKEGKINWFAELPLNPCNVIMLVTPIALYTMNRWLLSYVFFYSTFLPLLGILMPCTGFENYSILKPRIIGFYETHYMLLMAPPLMLVSKLYIPTYIDCLYAIAVFFVISVIVYIIDKLLIKTNKYNKANYFFLLKPYNKLLDLFYKYIPYEFFYITPALLVFIVVFLVITTIIKLFF